MKKSDSTNQHSLSRYFLKLAGLLFLTVSLSMQSQSQFLTRSGSQLMLNGSPYKFVGFNSFTLTGCGNANELYSDADLNTYFASLRPNSITRTWAFSSVSAGIARVVAAAAAHNQMLILTLSDGRCGCGETDGASAGGGSSKTPAWYQSGYQTNFLPWVSNIVNQYKNSTAIAMWEIINEPDDAGGNITALKNFLDNVAATIKSIDQNHLVSSGSWAEWAYGGQTQFQTIHSGANIDVGSLHEYDYDYMNSRTIVSGHYQPCLDAMNALNKPLIIGEMGILANSSSCLSTFQVRSDAMVQKMDAYVKNGGARGALIWNANLQTAETGCNNNVKPNDPLRTAVHDYVLPGSGGGGTGINLALNKTVTVSSTSTNNPANTGNKAVDGNATTTRWESLYVDPSWIYVDLGSAVSINHVILKWETAFADQYQIQVATTVGTWTTVFSTTTGNGATDDITFTAVNARYVRMNGTHRGTQYAYSLYEFEVYGAGGDTQAPSVPTGLTSSNTTQTGLTLSWTASTDNVAVTGYEVFQNGASIGTPATTSFNVTGLTCNTSYNFTVRARDAVPNWSAQTAAISRTTSACSGPGTNLALNKTVTVSTTSTINPANTGNKAVDGNATTTRWESQYTDPSWIYVDLGSAVSINHVILKWETAFADQYQIQVATTVGTWTTVFSTTTGNGGTDDITFTATNARYVRMNGTHRGTQYAYSLYEFEVYGSSGLRAMNPAGTPVNGIPALSLTVFPNPSKGRSVKALAEGYNNEAVAILVHDVTGRVVYRTAQTLGSTANIIELATGTLKKGTYILSVKGKKNVQQQKFIVD
jgi:chitodextrinase